MYVTHLRHGPGARGPTTRGQRRRSDVADPICEVFAHTSRSTPSLPAVMVMRDRDVHRTPTPSGGDVTNEVFIYTVRMRRDRDEAILDAFNKFETLKHTPKTEWKPNEAEFMANWDRYSSIFMHGTSTRDTWAPSSTEVTRLIRDSLQAVESDSQMPAWGVQTSAPCLTVADENAITKQTLEEKVKAHRAMLLKGSAKKIHKRNSEWEARSRIKTRPPSSPNVEIDYNREPMQRPFPVRAGDPAAVTADAIVNVAPLPPKRKAMCELSIHTNKKARSSSPLLGNVEVEESVRELSWEDDDCNS